MSASTKRAAVSLIEHGGRLLCVWNRRYSGWSLPGGLVEEGETPEQAQERELREETGLETFLRQKIFEGATGLNHEPSRAGYAVIFRVQPMPGAPREMEPGCPVKWLTREEFLASSPFAEFYERDVLPRLGAGVTSGGEA